MEGNFARLDNLLESVHTESRLNENSVNEPYHDSAYKKGVRSTVKPRIADPRRSVLESDIAIT